MKTFYCIGGTMGVGKTAVSQALKRRLPRCAFLDGDWCWDMDPFLVTEETKAMVMDNITHTLNNFLRCSAFENVVFCWVLHEQGIWNELLSKLDTAGWRVQPLVLVCSPEALARRLQKDIDAGLRTPDILDRSTARLPLYDALAVPRLDTSERGIDETADAIAAM